MSTKISKEEILKEAMVDADRARLDRIVAREAIFDALREAHKELCKASLTVNRVLYLHGEWSLGDLDEADTALCRVCKARGVFCNTVSRFRKILDAVAEA